MVPTNQSKIESLIDSIESAKLVSSIISSEDLVDAKPLFRFINRYDTTPSTRLRLYVVQTNKNEKEKWIANCLEKVDLKDRCYLCIPTLQNEWGWLEVEISKPMKLISELLSRREVDDFMILSQDQKGFLGMVEDEAEYLAFVFNNVEDLLADM